MWAGSTVSMKGGERVNQHKRSHDTCFWHFMAEVNLYTTYFLKDQSKFDTSVLIFFFLFKCKPKSLISLCELLEWLTTTCGTGSTSGSAATNLLYCCGLSMTSSFFGVLLALPCIVNTCGKIFPRQIPKRSCKPAYQVEKNLCTGKSLYISLFSP